MPRKSGTYRLTKIQEGFLGQNSKRWIRKKNLIKPRRQKWDVMVEEEDGEEETRWF